MTKKETAKFTDWPGPRVGKRGKRGIMKTKRRAKAARKAKKAYRKKR
jgi:hypothetical protein